MNGFLRSKPISVLVALLTLASTIAISLSSSAVHTHAQNTLSFSEFPIPTTSSQPWAITTGPDGNLWFTESNANNIGVINPTGTIIATYSVPPSFSEPTGITTGPDGNLWFTEGGPSPFGNKIGRITTSGTITEYPVPTNSSGPLGITTGPDGNLWFTEVNGNNIGVITPNGTITEYPIPTSGSEPISITTGPDGNLWFTEDIGKTIGRITPSGAITEYPLPSSHQPYGITKGPDGNLWFAEINGSSIGRITPSGTITEYPVPSGTGDPTYITTGPNGNLWFTEDGGNRVGEITLSGAITEYPAPTSMSQPLGITTGPDGNLWFVENEGNQIGRVNLSSLTPSPSPTPSGTWITPSNGFSVQAGSSLQLSANASPAQANSSIQHVDFAANWNGSWQTICTTTLSTNTFGCNWNLEANGIPVPNGAIQLQFTVYDSSGTTFLSPTLQGTITPPPVQPLSGKYNWSGYAVTGSQYTNVKGSWIQPGITCGKHENSRAVFWVGLDGFSSNTVEQIGTGATCQKGNASYFVWYEMVPKDPVPINCGSGLKAEDLVSAEVTYSGGKFNLSIDTPECSFVTTQTQQRAKLNSAEWIAEAPCQSSLLGLFCLNSKWPQFGTITFINCSAGGISIASGPTVTEIMTPKAQPSPLNANNTGFSVQWVSP